MSLELPVTYLKPADRQAIEEILSRRANEIAGFKSEYTQSPSHFGSVEFALSREITRLRGLANKVGLPKLEEEED